MSYQHIRLNIEADVATLTLSDPDTRNALSVDMAHEIGAALKAMAHPQMGVRCLVITGEGKAFCSGANVKNSTSAEERARSGGTVLQDHFHPLFRRLRDFHAPVVTAVNGAAAGAGMSLALMGDIVVCGRSAFFLQAFRNIGVVPDCGSSWFLPRLIGLARAREMSLLGERLGAEKALEWGMVNRVVDDEALMAETMRIGEHIAAGPLKAQGAIRRLYWASSENSFEQQLDMEDRLQEIAVLGPEAAEGKAAFAEKRKPDYRAITNW